MPRAPSSASHERGSPPPQPGRILAGILRRPSSGVRRSWRGRAGTASARRRTRDGLTQAQLAEAMGVTPERVSQIERGEVATIDAIARYIEALDGWLDLVASFADHTLTGPAEGTGAKAAE